MGNLFSLSNISVSVSFSPLSHPFLLFFSIPVYIPTSLSLSFSLNPLHSLSLTFLLFSLSLSTFLPLYLYLFLSIYMYVYFFLSLSLPVSLLSYNFTSIICWRDAKTVTHACLLTCRPSSRLLNHRVIDPRPL